MPPNVFQKPDRLPEDLVIAIEFVYKKLSLKFSQVEINAESKDYGACSFCLNGKKIIHRVSKITPTKTGQFVTIWKRGDDGDTKPYDINDDLDFLIITSRHNDKMGQFILPRFVLADKKVISANGKNGKRGIRIYPPWDIVTSKQAAITQEWQKDYFLSIRNSTTDLEAAKKLLF